MPLTTPARHENLVRGGRVHSTDGTMISYLARGSGPVIVCLHGGLGSALSLAPLADHLAGEFEVVTVNLRGHGTSQWGQSPPHITHEIDDILTICDAVGPIGALFGYSFGAVLALETALAAPDLIPALALYEPPLPVTYPIPDPALIEKAITAGLYEQLLLDATPGSGGLSDTELATIREDPLWLSKIAHAPTLVPTMQVLASLAPTVDQYSEVTTPTKLIVGTTSAPYILAGADLLADALPNLTRETLHGQGHHVDHQLLAQSLRTFLHAE
ncbi:alpha/beta fold hydrolase [Nocardia sp. NRRL WC-3656]|uniref:alpha/beta fold hydrolase n=1 Tax=Nocardia sp. NRRL WC-3656 TaxID=1463824 RepID=UPI00068F5A68|nr:alpha/beta hydrolase [Nocardia sp. NRRL WC-3656]